MPASRSSLRAIAGYGLLALAVLSTLPQAASAAYPGEDGTIAFGRVGSAFDKTSVWQVNADGTEPVPVKEDIPGFGSASPAYSPDGEKIAFASGSDVWVMDADGGNAHFVTSGSSPTWSPDAFYLAVSTSTSNGTGVKIVNAETGAVFNTIPPPPGSETPQSVYASPAWHPTDPNKIVVSWTQCCDRLPIFPWHHTDLAVISPDGGPHTLVTNDGEAEFEPDWSPNGNLLVFRHAQQGQTGSGGPGLGIWTVPAAGGGKVELSSDTTDSEPVFSPSGSRVAFLRGASNARQLAVMNANGGNQTVVLPDAAQEFAPSWQPAPSGELLVNTNKDTADPNTADGRCDTDNSKPGDQCTLRAAIQEANAREGADDIKFEIKKKDSKVIEPQTPLPVITEQIKIDGNTQPGATALKLAIELSGKDIPTATGLVLEDQGSRVEGLSVRSFKQGIGISAAGTGDHVIRGNWFGVDKGNSGYKAAPSLVGVESSSAFNLIELNQFSSSGDVKELADYAGGLDREGTTPEAQHAATLRALGAGIHLEGGASDNGIKSNTFGTAPNGERVGSGALDMGAIKFGNVAGVLLAPTTGSVTNNTIGGAVNNDANTFSGNVAGIMALGTAGAVTGTDITHNFIGPTDFQSPAEGVGNIAGVLAAGNVTALDLGGFTDDLGNQIGGNAIGVALGAGVTNATIQNNEIGTDKNLDDFVKDLSAKEPTFGYHNLFGVILGDTVNARLGGGGGAGNQIHGNMIGVQAGGSSAQGTEILGNSIGLSSPPGGSIDKLKVGKAGSVIGILENEGTGTAVGEPGAGNSFTGTVIGLLSVDTTQETVQANDFDKNGIAQVAGAPAEMSVGGTVAGTGNTYQRGIIGLLMVNGELQDGAEEASHIDDNPVEEKDRKKPFTADNADLGLDAVAPLVGDTDLTAAAVKIDPPDPGTLNKIQGNTFGADGFGGSALGNQVGAFIAGDITQTTFGTGPASTTLGANIVASNLLAGVWVGPAESVQTQVDMRGNTIIDNPADSVIGQRAGLGIDLLLPEGDDIDDSFGVTPNDPGDADDGANGLQNFPEIAGITNNGGGAITVDGSLASKPSTTYSIELYASIDCDEQGIGVGEMPIKRYDVTTDAGGSASIDTTATLPGALRESVTATATGSEGTSEFSECVTVP